MSDNKIFSAFLEEAEFTKEILAIGVTQLYKANYASQGIYYQSFTCLSTGLERLAKLCLILDYYIQQQGVLPSEKYIRNYGHRIPDLYNACCEVAKRQKVAFHFRYKMDERRCGQKVGLDTLKREIERCIQKNNITKLSRFMKKRDQ